MIELVYRGLASAVAPALVPWLSARARAGKEDPLRRGERRGIAGRARPPGPLVWLHAASVGEAMSVLPLVERLRARWPGVTLLFTSGTVTSAQLLGERLPAGCIHQFAPLDIPGWIRRFLDHWRPAAAIWVESEFWPNTIAALQRRGVPLALVNARMSPRSFARWRALAALLHPPLDAFAPCLAQDETVAERLRALGAAHVQCLGNLKFDAAPLPADDGEIARLRTAIDNRPVWLAASLHPGEAAAIAAAHRALVKSYPRLLTLVVPRHPARVAETLPAFAGLTVAQRSAGDALTPDVAVYVADTMGELGLFYRLARAVFVGGSLVPHGGQNPLEGARLGAALVLGPHMHNFPEITAALCGADGAEQIGQESELAPAIGRLLADPALAGARADAAHRVADANRGAVERVTAALTPLFEAALSDLSRAHA